MYTHIHTHTHNHTHTHSHTHLKKNKENLTLELERLYLLKPGLHYANFVSSMYVHITSTHTHTIIHVHTHLQKNEEGLSLEFVRLQLLKLGLELQSDIGTCRWWKFSKVSSIFIIYSTKSNEMTFENFYLTGAVAPPVNIVKVRERETRRWMRGVERGG